MSAALVIAAHGTRDEAGERTAHDLTARVAAMLPQVDVSVGFVELNEPSVPQALVDALQRQGEGPGHVVVVPLMLGTGTHVRKDIPGFIDEVREQFPGARVDYAAHLGPHPALFDAVAERMHDALGEWDPTETHLVMVGRGALVPEANADHVRLTRMHQELGSWQGSTACFIQVTRPSLPEGLDLAHAQGARQILVAGHWLFPGRLRTWTFAQTDAWARAHPECRVRVAEVIGDCDALAGVVVERWREMRPDRALSGSPAYLAGLLLEQRKVLLVGGGAVAERRVNTLLDAGARVRVVAPEVTPALSRLAQSGRVEWVPRAFTEQDLEGCWYVQATTDLPDVNALVAEACEERHIFCVRADDARAGTAWTPATTQVGASTVAVLSDRDPRRSAGLRDRIQEFLTREG